MQTTNIAWCQYSWNPITGCTRAGPECYDPVSEEVVCYAEILTRQQAQRDDPPDYVSDQSWTPENAAEVVTLHADRLDEPFEYHWPDGPGRIFVCSMSDLFHEQVDDTFIRQVLAVARQFPECIWICLTKRPERAVSLDVDWPANVWLGTSVGSGPGGEYADTTHRIDQLRQVDPATRWVSFEPLIEPVGEVDLTGIDWAVVGGETRTNPDTRRDMPHEWADEIRQQCRDQDVAYFFKQSSGQYPETGRRLSVYNDEFGVYEQRKIEEYPELPAVTREARGRLAATMDGDPP